MCVSPKAVIIVIIWYLLLKMTVRGIITDDIRNNIPTDVARQKSFVSMSLSEYYVIIIRVRSSALRVLRAVCRRYFEEIMSFPETAVVML